MCLVRKHVSSIILFPRSTVYSELLLGVEDESMLGAGGRRLPRVVGTGS